MDIDRADIATRLIEERTKAGYSQADFARQLDISREGLRLYEMGQRSINAEFLAKSAKFGIDVQYVLTGIKSKNITENQENKSNVVNISSGGSANVLQNAQSGSTINMINTQKHTTNTKVEVKPGITHITEGQAAKLQELVLTIVDLENKVRKSPRTYKGVWAALNSHCGVTRYRLIPLESYTKAEKYLYQWIGRLNSQASAPVVDNMEWRKRRYAYIKINTKNDQDWIDAYTRKRFRTTSLSELSDDELDRTYRAVAARKRKA